MQRHGCAEFLAERGDVGVGAQRASAPIEDAGASDRRTGGRDRGTQSKERQRLDRVRLQRQPGAGRAELRGALENGDVHAASFERDGQRQAADASACNDDVGDHQ